MKKEYSKYLFYSLIVFVVFIIYTICVKFVDVKAIGPNDPNVVLDPNSINVGFATINKFVHDLFGVHFGLYNATDIGSIIPIGLAILYAVIGAVQLIKYKDIKKVDKNIIALGVFYIATVIVYLFFEFVVINHRPVLIDGVLEASYPSSTTMLSLTFMITSIDQSNKYIKNDTAKKVVMWLSIAYSAFLVIGRIISGVHWFTDILGAVIVSTALILFYFGLKSYLINLSEKTE